MRVIHVLRKPLSEGTVASNVVKHGCGGINIDASRIGTGSTMRSQKPQNNGQSMNNGQWKGGATGSTKGRWPANVILQHLDGCRCGGTKQVPSHGHFPKSQKSNPGAHGKMGKGWAGEVAPERWMGSSGEEVVASWDCAPGCPVAALDEQSLSGGMHSAGNKQPAHFKIGNTIYAGGWKPTAPRNPDAYADKGGASRFFKQVGGSKECE